MEAVERRERPAGDERIRVSLADAIHILWPYVRARMTEQLRNLLPVSLYLFLFQIVLLRSPVHGAAAIAAALACAILGLMFFMEGLRLWLMPLGETIGRELPKRSYLPTIIGFAFLVGVGATLAEPALGSLRAVGANVDSARAPLLYGLLTRNAPALGAWVGVGVGLGVVLATFRFLFDWSLKVLIVPSVLLVCAMTAWAHADPVLAGIIGVTWDVGAAIAGPITIPLVLGLGLGICRSTGRTDSGMAGFGAATMISIMPIVASLAFAIRIRYGGSEGSPPLDVDAAAGGWLPGILSSSLAQALLTASQAILPLCVFLFIVHVIVLRERIARGDEIAVGLAFAFIGMGLFVLGLQAGLAPLGDQVGSTAPGAFSAIEAGAPPAEFGPLYGPVIGTGVIVLFAFFLGYGSTLAEPAVNALGGQVHEITVGAVPKKVLLHTVSFGVGLGMALGILRLLFGIPLASLLLPAYGLMLVLTLLSTEEFVSIGWDCGSVTTGPVTVPLVAALGLGISNNIPGVADGFGILSLATVGPILSVLVVGLLRRGGVFGSRRRGTERR